MRFELKKHTHKNRLIVQFVSEKLIWEMSQAAFPVLDTYFTYELLPSPNEHLCVIPKNSVIATLLEVDWTGVLADHAVTSITVVNTQLAKLCGNEGIGKQIFTETSRMAALLRSFLQKKAK